MSEHRKDNHSESAASKYLGIEDRLIKYIRYVDRWFDGGDESLSEIYEPDPMSVISAITDVSTREKYNDLCFDLEWNRGDVGASQTEGNYAFQRQVMFIYTVLRRIHIVSFDNGKKTIVAPDWEPFGAGRFYHYMRDSVEYAYQCICVYKDKDRRDDSKGLFRRNLRRNFDIPVIEKNELQRFVEYCGVTDTRTHTPDRDEQTKLFYDLLEKYEAFKLLNG